MEAKAEKTKQPSAQLLLRPFNKAKREGQLPTVELEDGTLPVGPVVVLGNVLPESQQPKLPADFCQ